jgi:hypothetical protein
MQSLCNLPRTGRILAHLVSFLLILAVPASACPTCSVGQAIETLALIMAFMTIPYVIAVSVWFAVRHLIATEELDS